VTGLTTSSWFHTIDFPDGTSTPGVFDHRAVATRVAWPDRLRGGRCLDVGTCDGFWAFTMERQGAGEVVAIDVNDGGPFDIARRTLSSGVKRIDCSVFDLDPAVHGRFDIVFCGALLIHLRDPIAALERMRDVCDGELVLVDVVDGFLDVVARRRPCASLAAVPGQWWRPNSAGLVRMVEVAGFEVVDRGPHAHSPLGAGAPRASLRRPRTLFGALADALVRARPGSSGLALFGGLARGGCLRPLRARPRLPEPRRA